MARKISNKAVKAALPALGAAGLTFSMVGGASAAAVPANDVTQATNYSPNQQITLGEEDCLAETPLLKEQRAASVKVVAKSEGRAIFQTLPYEVCSLPTTAPQFP